jgi:hypothetical protein
VLRKMERGIEYLTIGGKRMSDILKNLKFGGV